MDVDSKNIQTLILEQSLYANWIRNGLITTLIALGILGLLALDPTKERIYFRIFLKIIGIALVILAMWMFWSSTRISNKYHRELDIPKNYLITSSTYFIAYCLMIALVVLIFLFVWS